jgi:DNA (cytosine-5)-methyltransferase 1
MTAAVLAAPMRAPASHELTVSDYFCGAGGSSQGFLEVPGLVPVIAVNHWDEAIATHNANMPFVDHDQADISKVDPSRYPSTDIGWFSPECTYWSMARGVRCDYDSEQLALDLDDDEDDSPESADAKWRSRMLMEDVVRFARVHNYKGIIVENVPDILKWVYMDRWLKEMHVQGYKHKIVTLNSAFASALGQAAPQLRDRVYIVFWKAKYNTPNWDKWLRPPAWCTNCEQIVRGIYTPKLGGRRPMRYGPRAQYIYRCPTRRCKGAAVQPYVRPAAAAIDWSKLGERIGDRKKPLAEKTRARIRAGLLRYARPITAELAGNTFERRPGVRTWPVDRPLTTQHTTQAKGLACPPMLVPTGGTWNDTAASVADPMRTRLTRDNDAVVTPPFLALLRSDRPRTIDPFAGPLATVVADGAGHALITPLEGRDGLRARHAQEPLRTQTGRHTDAFVVPPMMVPLRNNGKAELVDDTPLRTFAANGNHHALVHPAMVMRNTTSRGNESRCTGTGEPLRTLMAEGPGQSLVAWHESMVMRNNTGFAEMSTPVDEPLRTLTTGGHQSLVRWDQRQQMLYQYDGGHMRPLEEPLPTQTTRSGDALLGLDIEVDDCTLRMLDVHEIQEGTGFDEQFGWLSRTTKRNRIKMLGNAVTPPASRDLAACLMEAITGIDVPLAAGWSVV